MFNLSPRSKFVSTKTGPFSRREPNCSTKAPFYRAGWRECARPRRRPRGPRPLRPRPQDNPATTRLLNAAKVSGRTRNGLGVGVFNAITANTYASVRSAEGEDYKILTQPLSDYSVVVLDQSLKNNSYVSLVNTNVSRMGAAYDANLTGGLFRLGDKQNTYALNGKIAVSQLYHPDSLGTDLGYTYRLDAGKVSGKWQYGFAHGFETDTYNPADLGFIYRNNEISQSAHVRYNIFKPFWKFNSFYSGLSTGYARLYKPFVFSDFSVDGYVNPTFRNFHEVYASVHWEPVHTYDYFEPRVKGRFYTYPINYQVSGGYSTDYRKKLAFDLSGSYREFYENNRYNLSAEISPRYRLNDRLTLRYNLNWGGRFDDVGFVDKLEADSVIFGRRDVSTVTNTINSSYIFTNRMSLTLRARHYWSKAQYQGYELLNETGYLETKDDYTEAHNVNFNAFNVDMVFSWWFAPGSEMSVVWKNAILTNEEDVNASFYRNLQNTMQSPQNNSVTVKVLYYLDAVAVKKKLFNKKGDKNVIASARENLLSAAP